MLPAESKSLSMLERVAYHEAGHAVAMYSKRFPFGAITIEATENYLGEVKGPGLSDDLRRALGDGGVESIARRLDKHRFRIRKVDTRRFAERAITCLMAGPAAEAIATGRWAFEPLPKFGLDLSDRGQALDLAIRMIERPNGEEEAFAFVEWLSIRIKWKLGLGWPSQWGAVEALAMELLEKRRIEAQEARRIIKTSIRAGETSFDEHPEREMRIRSLGGPGLTRSANSATDSG